MLLEIVFECFLCNVKLTDIIVYYPTIEKYILPKYVIVLIKVAQYDLFRQVYNPDKNILDWGNYYFLSI